MATMEDSLQIPKKLGINPPYDPAIPLLGIYTEETKIEKYTSTSIFTVAVFTIEHVCNMFTIEYIYNS